MNDKKVCLIIGGLGWLGSEYTRRCVSEGMKLIVLDFFEPELYSEQLGVAFSEIEYHHFDGYEHSKFSELLDEIFLVHENIDVLVNNAFDFSQRTGFSPDRNEFLKSTTSDWMNTFDSGIVWPMLATQRFLRQRCLENKRVINVGSMYALVAPSPDVYTNTAAYMLPQYGMAKAAIVNFTQYIASYFGELGVRCNVIVPGAFPKPENISREFTASLESRIPLGRIGAPSDLSGILAFLVSDDSGYITGQTIVADGGWTIR